MIDQYLAKKFNLLGDNEYEEWTIKAHYSNIHYLRERSLMKMTWTWADKRAEALELFLKTTLPDFIVNHEFHLRGNGSNGHYVGDRVSWSSLFLFHCFASDKFHCACIGPPASLVFVYHRRTQLTSIASFSLSLPCSLIALTRRYPSCERNGSLLTTAQRREVHGPVCKVRAVDQGPSEC